MTDWIKAANPVAPITTTAEARAAARASALAIFLGVAWGAVGAYILATGGSAEIEAAMAEAAGDAPEMAGMGAVAMQIALWSAVGLCVIQLILGLIQWAKPNIVIPILFTILVAFGLLSGLAGIMMAGQNGMPATAAAPTWQVWTGFAVLVIQLILHIAGIRGANALGRFLVAEAQ